MAGLDLQGGPGAGTIDAAGLYLAPDKGSLPFGLTDIVVATSTDDPFRKAFARVAIVGWDPNQSPPPRLRSILTGPICTTRAATTTITSMAAIRCRFSAPWFATPTRRWWSEHLGSPVHHRPRVSVYLEWVALAVRIDATVPVTTPAVTDWATVYAAQLYLPGIVTDLALRVAKERLLCYAREDASNRLYTDHFKSPDNLRQQTSRAIDVTESGGRSDTYLKISTRHFAPRVYAQRNSKPGLRDGRNHGKQAGHRGASNFR